MDGIIPLNTSLQRFLQRLLSVHVANDAELQEIWNEIHNDNESMGRDLNDTLSIINRSLKPAFDLEIRSVSLALNIGLGTDDLEEDAGHPQIYHTVINCNGDDVSKATANPDMTKNPHELALFRLIIERLIESSNDDGGDDDGGDDDNEGSARKRRRRDRRGAGCQASLSRMSMINFRTELKGAHAGKLSIDQVQNALNLFVAQGWLVQAANPNGDKQRTPDARKKKRTSFGGSYLQLGPRSYMEFPDFLTKAGLDQENLPQILSH
jgi:hypothetical protein|eukprot:scaffold5242_cov287-Chaetoceros_neogracile.AAC.9